MYEECVSDLLQNCLLMDLCSHLMWREYISPPVYKFWYSSIYVDGLVIRQVQKAYKKTHLVFIQLHNLALEQQD